MTDKINHSRFNNTDIPKVVPQVLLCIVLSTMTQVSLANPPIVYPAGEAPYVINGHILPSNGATRVYSNAQAAPKAISPPFNKSLQAARNALYECRRATNNRVAQIIPICETAYNKAKEVTNTFFADTRNKRTATQIIGSPSVQNWLTNLSLRAARSGAEVAQDYGKKAPQTTRKPAPKNTVRAPNTAASRKVATFIGSGMIEAGRWAMYNPGKVLTVDAAVKGGFPYFVNWSQKMTLKYWTEALNNAKGNPHLLTQLHNNNVNSEQVRLLEQAIETTEMPHQAAVRNIGELWNQSFPINATPNYVQPHGDASQDNSTTIYPASTYATVKYTVRAGDSIFKICESTQNLCASEIFRQNGNSNNIKIGRVFDIPQ